MTDWKAVAPIAVMGLTSLAVSAQSSSTTSRADSVVAGVVIVREGDRDTPIRRATVVLRGGPVARPRVATTDDEGLFRFNGVSGGHYVISASAAGYVGGRFGAPPDAVTPGAALVVLAGARREDLKLELARGAVIAGRVFGPDQEPWPAANITLLKLRRFGYETSTTRVASTRTNDLGEFRFFGLPAGSYTVAAINSQLDADSVQVIPGSWFRYGSATPGVAEAPSEAIATVVTFTPSYSRATADPGMADVISVRLGEERLNTDISLLRVEARSISGTVEAAEGGTPGGVTLSLSSASTTLGLRPAGLGRTLVRPDGTFMRPALPPGKYRLSARARRVDGSAVWAQADVTLAGEDVRVPPLRLSPAIRIEGAIESSATTIAPAALRLRLLPLEAEEKIVTATVTSMGTFSADGLLPGRYRIEIAVSSGERVSLTHVTLRGGDGTEVTQAADSVITVPPNAGVINVVARISTTPAAVRGVVRDGAGRPVRDHTLVLFSKEEARWRPDTLTTRLTRPGDDGEYVFDNVPAGDYYIAMLIGLDEDTLADPSVFRALTEAGATLRVVEGATTRMDLLVPGR